MKNLLNRQWLVAMFSVFLSLITGCASTQNSAYDLQINVWNINKLPQKLQNDIKGVLVLENTRGAFHQDFSPKFGAILRGGSDLKETPCEKIQEGDFSGINKGSWERDLKKRVFEVTYVSGLLTQKTVEVATFAGIACLSFDSPVNATVRLKGSQENLLSPTKPQGAVKTTPTDWDRQKGKKLNIHFLTQEELE